MILLELFIEGQDCPKTVLSILLLHPHFHPRGADGPTPHPFEEDTYPENSDGGDKYNY